MPRCPLYCSATIAVVLLGLQGCTPVMAVGDTPVKAVRQRWQHLCVERATAKEATEKANALGSKGWELVDVANGSNGLVLCFRRP